MFSELIKNFERVRRYLREFLVYGFRTREEVGSRSARSYDNERRRLESWLGDFMSFRRTASGKAVFFAADSRQLAHNPLYAAFKARSFTDADITLYFLLLDLLEGASLTLAEVEEGLIRNYPSAFAESMPDASTLRKKLEEYAALGLTEKSRSGRTVRYRKGEDFPLEPWAEALAFFSEAAPCGAVGSFLLDLLPERPSPFGFKHRHLTQAMESEVLCDLLRACREGREVEMRSFTRRGRGEKEQKVVPLSVFVSVQSGRRYLMAWNDSQKAVRSYRLDYTAEVRPGPIRPDVARLRQKLEDLRPRMFGVQTGKEEREVSFTVRLLAGEGYVADRLRAEARCGRVENLGQGRWRFSAVVCNDEEINPWMRTFLGRLEDFRFSHRSTELRFRSDLERMYELYDVPEGEALRSAAAALFPGAAGEALLQDAVAAGAGQKEGPDPHGADFQDVPPTDRPAGQEGGAAKEAGAGVVSVSARDEGAAALAGSEGEAVPRRGEDPARRAGERAALCKEGAVGKEIGQGEESPEPLSEAERGRKPAPLFHEVYGLYFKAVGEILREAVGGSLTEQRLTELAGTAFAESPLTILPALRSGRWPLLEGLSTPLKHPPRRPLTHLELGFLRALADDPRLGLFGELPLPQVPPLYRAADVVFFDRRTDGDPFGDPAYREIFSAVLRAVRERRWLSGVYLNRKGYLRKFRLCPLRLEYSFKDDKFRLICGPQAKTLNLARIRSLELGEPFAPFPEPVRTRLPLELEVTDERNALERVLLHFADLEKRAERLPDGRYGVRLLYDPEDETELLIRVLSFGPMVKVTTPAFAALVRRRLIRQRVISGQTQNSAVRNFGRT